MVKALHTAITTHDTKKMKRLPPLTRTKVNQLLITPNKNDITTHKNTVHQVDGLQFCSHSPAALLYIKKFSVCLRTLQPETS